MKLLFLGDIFGKPGRDVVEEHLGSIIKEHGIDYTVINAENAAHGSGITPQIAKELFEWGADCITTGNHAWDRREIIPYINQENRLLRPANYPVGTAGYEAYLGESQSGKKVLTVNLMGRLFMDPLDCPFAKIETILEPYELGKNVDFIFIDMHAEATSEKQAMAHFLDGRVTGVVGSHTHVPTADSVIYRGGTAFQSDAGMCGNYHSVVGAEPGTALPRFRKEIDAPRLSPDVTEAGTLCAVVIESDDKTGLAKDIYPIRKGGILRLQAA